MAANFMGLGVSFGAKDDGLLDMQEDVLTGLTDIVDKLLELSDSAAKRASSAMGEVGEALPTDKVESLSQQVDDLSDSLGTSFVEASEDAEQSFSDGLTGMSSALDSLGGSLEDGVSAVGRFAKSLATKALAKFSADVAYTVDTVKGFFNTLGSGINLADSIEDQFVAMDKQARALGANYGYTGEKLAEFSSEASSMAYNLNTSVDVTGQAIRGFSEMEAGVDGLTEALGLTAETMAKLQDTGLITSDTLRNTTMRMNKELKLTPEQIDRIFDSYVQMGRAQGNVNTGVEQLNDLNEKLARLNAMGYSTDEMEDYAKQTAALQVGMYQFAQSSELAAQQQQAMSETMVASKEGFADLLYGVGQELPDVQTGLMQMFGKADVAFDMLGQGPEEFMMGLSDVVRKMGGWSNLSTDYQGYITTYMRKSFGTNAAAFENFIKSVDGNVVAMMDQTYNAQVNLGELADEAHRTGITLAESWQRVRDSFQHHFNKIAREDARQFVKDTDKEFDEFSDKLTAIAEEGGPMGMFVEKMSLATQIGVQAFLPQALRPMAALFGEMASQIGPTATALGAMGFRLSSLTNPAFLAVGAVAALGGWFYTLIDAGYSTEEALGKMWDDIVSTFDKAVDTVSQAIDTVLDKLLEWTSWAELLSRFIDWEAWWDDIFDAMTKAFESNSDGVDGVFSGVWDEIEAVFGPKRAQSRVGKITENLIKTFGRIFDGLQASLEKRLTGPDGPASLFEGLGERIRGIDWASTVGGAMSTVGPLLAAPFDMLKKIPFEEILTVAFSGVAMLVENLGNQALGEGLAKVMEGLAAQTALQATAAVGAAKAALNVLETMDVSKSARNIGENLVKGIMGYLQGLLPTIELVLAELPGIAERAGSLIVQTAKTLPEEMGGLLRSLGEQLGPWLSSLVPMLMDAALGLYKWMFWDLPTEVLTELPNIVVGVFEMMFIDLPIFVGDLVMGLLDGIVSWFEERFPEVGKPMREAFTALQEAWDFVKMRWDKHMDGMKEKAQTVSDFIAEVFRFEWVVPAAEAAWAGIQAAAQATADAVVAAWDAVAQFFVDLGSGAVSAWDGFVAFLTGLPAQVGQAADQSVALIIAAIAAVPELVVSLLQGVVEFWVGLGDMLVAGLDAALSWIGETFPNLERILRVPFDTMVAVWEIAKDVITRGFEGLGDVAEQVGKGIQTVYTGVWNTIKALALGAFNAITSGAEFAWNMLGQLFEGGIGLISEAWTAFTDAVAGTWKNAVDLVAGYIGDLAQLGQNISDKFTEAADSIAAAGTWAVEKIVAVGTSLVDGFIGAVKGIGSWVDDFFLSPLAELVEAGAGALPDFVTWIGDNILKPVMDTIGKVKDVGLAFIENIRLGIEEGWSDFVDWLRSKLEDPVALLTGSEPEDTTSPWTDLGARGEAFVGMIRGGVETQWPLFMAWWNEQLQQMVLPLDVLTGITPPAEGAEPAVATATWFSIGDTVATDLSGAQVAIEEFAAQAVTSLDSIVAKVDIEFGASQSDVIIADFDAAYLGVDSFATRATERLDTFRAGVSELFTGLWGDVLDLTDRVIMALSTDVGSVASDMYAMVDAMDALNTASAEAEAAKIVMTMPSPALDASRPVDVQILEATHLPYWYTAMADARLQALGSKLDKLIELAKTGTSQGAATTGTKKTNSAALAHELTSPLGKGGEMQTGYQVGGGR